MGAQKLAHGLALFLDLGADNLDGFHDDSPAPLSRRRRSTGARRGHQTPAEVNARLKPPEKPSKTRP
jgi:hypothetical protein